MRSLDRGVSSNRRLKPINRIIFAILATIILFIILGVGSSMPLSGEEARQFMKQFEDLTEDLSTLRIFMNNLMIALLSFIPFIGVGITGYVIFQTGKFLGYISTKSGIHPALFILFSIMMVYGLMEFLAYGVAASEGIILSYSLIRRRFRSEIKWLLISMGISAILLLAAAALESFLVSAFKEVISSSAVF